MNKFVGCRFSEVEYEALLQYCKSNGIKTPSGALRLLVVNGMYEKKTVQESQWILLSEIKDLLAETLELSAGSLASTMLLRDQIIPSNTPIEDRKRLAKEFISDSLFAGEAIVKKRRTGEYNKEES